MKAKTIAQILAVLLFVVLPIGWLVACGTHSATDSTATADRYLHAPTAPLAEAEPQQPGMQQQMQQSMQQLR